MTKSQISPIRASPSITPQEKRTCFSGLLQMRLPTCLVPEMKIVFSSIAVVLFGLAIPISATGQNQDSLEMSSTVRILAASSLSQVLPGILESIPDLGHNGTTLLLDSTSRLASQVASGAPGDLFLSANREWIDWLSDRRLIVDSTISVLAEGRLVLAVPAVSASETDTGNGLGIESARALLADPDSRIALAGENVPLGRYGEAALEAFVGASFLESGLIRGTNARGVVEWVARGEVSAGVLYESDVLGDRRLAVLYQFPTESHPPVRYYGAVLARARSPRFAEVVLGHLASIEVREVLAARGFQPPSVERLGRTQESSQSAQVDLFSAISRSLLVGLISMILGSPLAIGLGWVLARKEFPGKSLVSMFTLAPLVFPPVVTGFLLLYLLGAQGPVGSILSSLGITLPFTFASASLAALVVGLPLYVVSVRGAFEAVDHRLEELAWTLGEKPRRTFLRVSFPLALPGIAAGAMLAFARGLGEFGATVVIAGNIEGETRTIPLAIYSLLESPDGWSQIWILVGASVVLSFAALVGYEVLSKRQKEKLEVLGHG